MKLAVRFDSSYSEKFLVVDASDATALIQAMASGQLYERKSYGQDGPEFKPAGDAKPEVIFVTDADLDALPEPLAKLHKEREYADQRWLASYQECATLKKERDELKAKLEAVQTATA